MSPTTSGTAPLIEGFLKASVFGRKAAGMLHCSDLRAGLQPTWHVLSAAKPLCQGICIYPPQVVQG